MLKKGCLVLLMIVLVGVFTGCNMSTTVETDANGKGIISYKMNVKKDDFEGSDYIVAKDVDEFASMLEAKMEPSLNINVSVDKTSNNQEDIIVVSYSYNSLEEYNAFVEKVYKQYTQLVSGTNIYEIYGYDKEEDNKDYTVEYEALSEYMASQGIYVDTSNRNCRKFIKILKEYVQDARIKCGVRQTKDSYKTYVKLVEDNNGKQMCVNYMALNCLDMYVKKIVESSKDEFFKLDYIDQNEKELTSFGDKEVLKKTFEAFELSTKVKKAIDDKNGCVSQQYSMNDVTPVMSVRLFDEKAIKEFKNIYIEQRVQYEAERLENISNLKLSFKEMEDMYAEKTKTYELSFGDNKIEFTDDNLFDLYNDEGFICVTCKENNSEVFNLENEEYEDITTNVTDTTTVDNKKMDNTPLTGDRSVVEMISLVGLVAFMVILVIFIIEKNKNRM